mmetsp:Transcript_12046/g.22410  ORF Transcript_12046/g.22410 Transcript_12046/m.22410 type:complete len:339 (+) Transcript_12046:108-1124(+)|eukprot:CAMPEP_0201930404 /NCGR_PEP_ID=MMETSP0903-20130614/25100_1 /ASSEMBLY_ACC=CAM_ASM_000552 /TAXON_ID=420261 /ORGANISM="Thalassiosira antarctica, Strain CCMP982" /LENGTH=338 /DNA_ID=CAMNT_0048469461 /DNA_START=213 /DNA_END=1229 /DNA_ORIENTATION=-
MSTETLEEMTARHKKELKSFEGEKRAAIKNAKSRGKKAKGAVKDAEFKCQGLEMDLKERHRMEVEHFSSGDGDGGTEEEAADTVVVDKEETTRPQPTTSTTPSSEEPTPEQIEEAKRQKAIEKKLKKKNAQLQKEIDRETRIKEENASAGPSRRQMEIEAMQTLFLHPRGLDVQEVEADGNCLYRAVGVQCRRLGLDAVDSNGEGCYGKIRELCANVLMGSNRAEFEPFAECGEGHAGDGNDGGGTHPATFEEYVTNVRSTSTWGGQLELRALSEGLKCPIVVFSAEGSPLTMGAEYAPSAEKDGGDGNDWDKKKALLLSFHRHYYALGEHYNSVIPK